MLNTLRFLSMSLIFLVAVSVHAQKNNTLSLPGIPYILKWENRTEPFSLGKSELYIRAGAKTDMFRDPQATYNTDNAPKLMFLADSNFVLSAGISHPFTSKWDGGAIIIRQDSLHWVKFCYEKDYTGAHRVVSVVTRDISDDCNSVSFDSDNVYLKVAKSGRAITLYCSPDNVNWLLVRHFQLEAPGRVEAGFLAQSPDGPGTQVRFSDIQYQAVKIKDPYSGQ